MVNSFDSMSMGSCGISPPDRRAAPVRHRWHNCRTSRPSAIAPALVLSVDRWLRPVHLCYPTEISYGIPFCKWKIIRKCTSFVRHMNKWLSKRTWTSPREVHRSDWPNPIVLFEHFDDITVGFSWSFAPIRDANTLLSNRNQPSWSPMALDSCWSVNIWPPIDWCLKRTEKCSRVNTLPNGHRNDWIYQEIHRMIDLLGGCTAVDGVQSCLVPADLSNRSYTSMWVVIWPRN